MLGIGIGISRRKNVISQAIAVLRSFGSDAHVYMPGIGWMNGLQAGNYLESTGQTPATVDSPVGLVLDGMGSLGSELVSNGDFSNGTADTNVGAYGSTLSVTDGVLRVTRTGIIGLAVKLVSGLTINKSYKVSARSIANSGGSNFDFRVGPTPESSSYYRDNTSATAKTYEAVFTATATTAEVSLFFAGSGIGSWAEWDDISVKEVTGIQATRATTEQKPILRRGAVNLALQSATPAFQSITVTATPYTLALIGTGSVAVTGTGTGTLSGTGASDLVVLTFTPTAGAAIFTPVGSVTKIGVFRGTYTASQIQALGGIPLTTTAPASTTLGPYFWEFDGSNDSLSLGSVPFQMADNHCVIVGVSFSTGSNGSVLCINAAGVNAQYVARIGRSAANTVRVDWRDDSANNIAITGTLNDGVSGVVSGRNIAGAKVGRVNGTQIGMNSTVQGTTTLNFAGIGIFNGLTPSYLNGAIYPVIAIKGTVSDAQLLTLEKWVASASGVTI